MREKTYPKEILEITESLTLFDDELMSRVFDKNIEATELILRIILGRNVHVISAKCEDKLKNHAFDGRSVILDIHAIEEDGRQIDIEVQSSSAGSSIRRVRFHSSMMDSRMLKKGQDFDELKDSYVIFIYKSDKFGKGLPLYTIDRFVGETGDRVDDGSHIIYVNGTYKGDDEIGRLIQDFRQSDSKKMNYKQLSEGVEHFKNTKKGQNDMNEALERYAQQRASEASRIAVENKNKEIAYNLKNKGISIDQIADIIGCQIDIVKGWLTPSMAK